MVNVTELIRATRRSLAVTTAIAAVATGIAVLGTGTPANAGTAERDRCPSDYACLWLDANWLPGSSRWQGALNNNELPASIDGKASSSYNHGTSCTAHFNTEPFYNGIDMPEGIGSFRQNLFLDPKPGGGNWNDVIRSLWWCSKH